MTYEKKLWQDRIKDAEGKIVQEGTPFSAGNMNRMEGGIYESYELSNFLSQEILQATRDIDDNKAEIGQVSLTNTLEYPFNDSKKTVALTVARNKINGYQVSTEVVTTDGPVGDIVVSDKQTNGFKIEYTGSAKNVTIKYFLRGGIK